MPAINLRASLCTCHGKSILEKSSPCTKEKTIISSLGIYFLRNCKKLSPSFYFSALKNSCTKHEYAFFWRKTSYTSSSLWAVNGWMIGPCSERNRVPGLINVRWKQLDGCGRHTMWFHLCETRYRGFFLMWWRLKLASGNELGSGAVWAQKVY